MTEVVAALEDHNNLTRHYQQQESKRCINQITRDFHQNILLMLNKSGNYDYDKKSNHTINDDNTTVSALKSSSSLLSSFSTSACQNIVTQHVLDHLPARRQPKKQINTSESVEYLACRTCGAILHPGWNDTTIRISRHSSLSNTKRRTLARRRQRRKKRHAIAASKVAHVGGFNNSNKTYQLMEPQRLKNGKMSNGVSVVILSDDEYDTTPTAGSNVVAENLKNSYMFLDRHHLVLKCGVCHDKIRLKGVKQKQKIRQDDSNNNSKHTTLQMEAKGRSIKSDRRRENMNTRAALNNDGGQNYPSKINDDMNEEFVSVPKLTKPNIVPQRRSLLQDNKKKRKTKKKPSQLMDFLSTLND